jgi:hypothetical protein
MKYVALKDHMFAHASDSRTAHVYSYKSGEVYASDTLIQGVIEAHIKNGYLKEISDDDAEFLQLEQEEAIKKSDISDDDAEKKKPGRPKAN